MAAPGIAIIATTRRKMNQKDDAGGGGRGDWNEILVRKADNGGAVVQVMYKDGEPKTMTFKSMDEVGQFITGGGDAAAPGDDSTPGPGPEQTPEVPAGGGPDAEGDEPMPDDEGDAGA